MPEERAQTALRIWRRHEQRRRDGLPTVSVLLTGAAADVELLESALATLGRTLLITNASDPAGMAEAWLNALAAERDLVDEAFALVARALEQPERELRAAWAARNDRERSAWLEACADDAPDLRAVLATLRTAIEPGGPRDDTAPDTTSKLRTLLSWWPERERLVLCAAVSGPVSLHTLLALAVDTPAWPLLATVEHTAWPSIRQSLNSRNRTLLDEAILPTLRPELDRAPVDPSERFAHERGGPAALAARAATIELPATQPFATASGALPETRAVDLQTAAADALTQAERAVASQAPEAEVLSQRARSQAERRLYQLLQADPITRDQFALNQRMPFTFGRARAEVDLVCSELRVALEVDGYHHFRELTAYRRDRRKDVLLQHHGYIVSRHLADDVVERPGEVVRAIRDLVQRRRRAQRRESAR